MHALIGTEGKRVLDRLFHAVGTQTYHGDLALTETLADPKGFFDREFIVGVRDPFHAARVDRAAVQLNASLCIRYLLHEDENVHGTGFPEVISWNSEPGSIVR